MFAPAPPMSSPGPSRLALLALALPGLPMIAWLAVIALQQALEAGRAEFWMMAWSLAFVVGGPALLLLLPAVERLQASIRGGGIIPRAGVKNP